MVGDLVTWEKVRDVLTLDDDQEDLIKFLISSASSQAERYADRFLAARDVSLRLDARGGRELLLPSYPVNSVDRICIDYTERHFHLTDDLAADGYSIKFGIIRLINQVFPIGFDVVLFEGNIGYDPVPDDLQQAVIEVISANFRRFSGIGGSVGIKQISAQGAITTQYEIDVPLSSRQVFLSYRGARI